MLSPSNHVPNVEGQIMPKYILNLKVRKVYTDEIVDLYIDRYSTAAVLYIDPWSSNLYLRNSDQYFIVQESAEELQAKVWND